MCILIKSQLIMICVLILYVCIAIVFILFICTIAGKLSETVC